MKSRLGSRVDIKPAAYRRNHRRYLDAAIVTALVLLTAALLLPGCGSLPMEMWDESRNANNAIEMATSGHWLVTTFDGLPDHWNTKPPLLVWLIAALLRTGLPPLLALRLPSAMAATATVMLLFLFCRTVLHDRLAGILSALLVLASTLFMGPHVSRTGDYDAILSFFILAGVLSFWRYVDTVCARQRRWLAVAGVSLAFALLTKGIVAFFVVPGLLLYLVAKRRLLSSIRDGWLWLTVLAVLLVGSAYYLGREVLDPGYLRAVWENEIGGRYLRTLEMHQAGPLYYLRILLQSFQPGIVFVPLLILSLFSEKSRRRDLALVNALAAAALLIVISTAGTKIYWYPAPLIPLLALAIGITVTERLASLRTAFGASRVALLPYAVTTAAVFVTVGIAIARGPYVQSASVLTAWERPSMSQMWYGTFLEKLRADGMSANVLIVDGGAANDAGMNNYHPIADFYRKYEDRHGFGPVAIAEPNSTIAAGTWVLTCDFVVRRMLQVAPSFTAFRRGPECLFGQMRGSTAIILPPTPHVGA